ncbi:MAG TPA: hypothetical protein VF183_10265 [Acidimicrobiales bacterium]
MPASTPLGTTPFLSEDERGLARYLVGGVLIAMVVFAVLTTLIVGLASTTESWGFAFAVGGFAGFWAGLFFGSAGGMIVCQWRKAVRDRAAARAEAEERGMRSARDDDIVGAGTVTKVASVSSREPERAETARDRDVERPQPRR